MTIDARRELEEAIALLSKSISFGEEMHKATELVCKAASAYAATLPREVPVETWALVDNTGDIIATGYDSKDDARGSTTDGRYHPVRLTGTALLPPREKD